MRYAIFGGSFDPPHLGHLAVAQAAQKHLNLQEVVFVPNARNPLRTPTRATAEQRLEMVRRLVDGEPGLSVSDIEVTRGGRSFAVDTIQEFTLVNPGQIWFLMGTDTLKGIESWRKPDLLVKLCRLAVVVRQPEIMGRVLSQIPEIYHDFIDEVPMPPKAVSSSKIREELLRGVSPEIHLKPGVWDFIVEHELYHHPEEERD